MRTTKSNNRGNVIPNHHMGYWSASNDANSQNDSSLIDADEQGMQDYLAHLAKEDRFDTQIKKEHNEPMTEPLSRPELDAKLATAEAKTDGQFALLNQRLSGIEEKVAGQSRSTWASTAVIVATIFAALALLVASFDSGRDTANLMSEAKSLLQDIRAEQRAAQQAPATQPAKP